MILNAGYPWKPKVLNSAHFDRGRGPLPEFGQERLPAGLEPPQRAPPSSLQNVQRREVAVSPVFGMFQKFSILTPTPMLGYGYPLEQFWHGIHTYKPSAIIVDSGSTDPGPYLLGTGVKLCSKASYIRDLMPLLDACHQYGTRLLVSSAGGDGTIAHVDELVGFINEICEAKHYTFKVVPHIFTLTM